VFSFNGKKIIILSPEDWGINFISKHHYALELSKNNQVYFIHTKPHSEQKEFVTTEIINNTLKVVRLKSVARGIFRLPFFIIDLQNKFLIKKIYKALNVKNVDVVWSFEQSKFLNLKQFNANINIFHPVDYIIKAKPFVSRIADSANIVLSVSNEILDTIKTNTPKYFINHSIDELFFKNAPHKHSHDKINVAYIGNLNMKFIDWENLIKIVSKNKNVNFTFIGPYQNSNLGGNNNIEQISILKEFTNVILLGSKNKKELVELLPQFDIFLVCYDNKKYPIEVSNTHKIIEYLSTGKVIVSNKIPLYENKGLIEMVEDNSQLVYKFKEVIENLSYFNSEDKIKQRILYANENTYLKNTSRIELLIKELN
jgi:hypothetical protein